MNDPGSLQNLNDIVLPGAVPWWPPAPGWYVVLIVMAAVLLWGAFRTLKAWRKNSYRRQAVQELSKIRKQGSTAAVDIPVLLKRAALSAWPRIDVAGLTGSAWHGFLDRTAPGASFPPTAALILDRLSYSARGAYEPSREEFELLCAATECWIRRHRVEQA